MSLSGEMTQSGHRLQLTFQGCLLPSEKEVLLGDPWFALFIFLGRKPYFKGSGNVVFSLQLSNVVK